MSFEKGKPKTGGRKKGTPNKATDRAREAIAEFVDANADKLAEWLTRVAEDDPKGAIDSFTKIAEYHMPKLARVDSNQTLQNPDGSAIFDKIQFEVVKADGKSQADDS